MNAQDKVLECFPRGEARMQRTNSQQGTESSIECGYWIIFAGPEADAEVLGWGNDETEAWADAAGLRGNQAA
jgi:hypothetical protein